jgi:hypothetical protein
MIIQMWPVYQVLLLLFQPDTLFSSRIQSLCPTITGDVCCTVDQFDTLHQQVQQVNVLIAEESTWTMHFNKQINVVISFLFDIDQMINQESHVNECLTFTNRSQSSVKLSLQCMIFFLFFFSRRNVW